MAFPIAAAIGLGGSLIGASAAKKAAARQAEAMLKAAAMEDQRIRELTAPYLENYKWASGLTKETVGKVLMPQLGKESDILKGQQEQSLSDIAKQKRLALGKSALFWGRTGNQGKARGEELQIGQLATDATNRAKLSYGASQESYKDQTTARLMQALGGAAATGAHGLGVAAQGARDVASTTMDAARVRSQGTQDFAQGLGGLGGALVGDWLGQREQDRLAKLLGLAKTKTATN